MAELDFSRLPVGQREWSTFVQALSKEDDRAERHFLEMKSDVDLGTILGAAKVAKFILGAANRLPEKADKRFGGSALLVLGISQDSITGIPFFEAMDLERHVKKYIGDDGPHWDFERVRVSGDRDVIIVIVDPPKQGDPIWTCHKDGSENLIDGGIFIRVDGATRAAKGAEVRTLHRRAEKAQPTAEIDVSIVGSVLPFHCDADVLEAHIARQREFLHTAYKEQTRPSAAHLASASFSEFLAADWGRIGAKPEPRTVSEYNEEVDRWEVDLRKAFHSLVDNFATLVAVPIRVQVRNLSATFMEAVEVKIELDGGVYALHQIPRDEIFEPLPDFPRPWGPIEQPGLGMVQIPDLGRHYPPLTLPSTRFDSVRFHNGDHVSLSVRLPELRPEGTSLTDDDEFVLVVRGAVSQAIKGSWTATARGHHQVYSGDLSIGIDSLRDFSEPIGEALDVYAGEDVDDDDVEQD